jgi:hypothetical protein
MYAIDTFMKPTSLNEGKCVSQTQGGGHIVDDFASRVECRLMANNPRYAGGAVADRPQGIRAEHATVRFLLRQTRRTRDQHWPERHRERSLIDDINSTR